jgi:8-oxo-dGTP pyrophosphatase MutT (NUDIX family)
VRHPELADLVAGAIDLKDNLCRELFEETGLTGEDFVMAPGW